jgi:hypothetical protein
MAKAPLSQPSPEPRPRRSASFDVGEPEAIVRSLRHSVPRQSPGLSSARCWLRWAGQQAREIPDHERIELTIQQQHRVAKHSLRHQTEGA